MEEHNRIKELLYRYETAGLIRRDSDEVLSYLTEDIIGIGLGEQGMVTSREDIVRIMLHTHKEVPGAAYSLKIRDIIINFSSGETANLCANIYVTRTCGGTESVSGFAQSLSVVCREGEWRICALHASPVMLCEESIRSYPLSFADHTLDRLKADLQKETFTLMDQSFSGGILGVYMNEAYSLYFANESLIKLLGYGKEEFYGLFAGSVRKLFCQEDAGEQQELHWKSLSGGEARERRRLIRKDGSMIWAEIRTKKTKDDYGKDILLSVLVDVTELVNLQLEANRQNRQIVDSVHYAERIQHKIIPGKRRFAAAFSDSAVIWEPRDFLSGDIYWMKRFEKGSVLAAGDCTGHGIPGALLTMLIVATLDSFVREENCQNTAAILAGVDRWVHETLEPEAARKDRMGEVHDGCDLAVLFISNDKKITLSSGNMDVFVCDGKNTERIRGQRLKVGEGKIHGSGDVKAIALRNTGAEKYYVVSDGFFGQIGGADGLPFGYSRFESLLLAIHGDSLKEGTGRIWQSFLEYQGDNDRRDDCMAVAFRP